MMPLPMSWSTSYFCLCNAQTSSDCTYVSKVLWRALVQALVTSPTSPISDFYPLNFSLDAEGKRQDWEAVVLLDFIDVPRLKQAESFIDPRLLTEEERARNQPGPLLYFVYDPGSYSTDFSFLPPSRATM